MKIDRPVQRTTFHIEKKILALKQMKFASFIEWKKLSEREIKRAGFNPAVEFEVNLLAIY